MAESVVRPRKWALFVYMCADVPQPGMKVSSERSLQQILSVGSNDQVGIAVQIARADHWTYRYIFPAQTPGPEPATLDAEEVFPTIDSASPAEIEAFFQWASAVCPAEKIMLVLWGHGFGLDYYVPPEFNEGPGDWNDLKKAHLADNPDAFATDFKANRFTLSTEKLLHLSPGVGPDVLTPRSLLPAEPAVGTDQPVHDVLLNAEIGDVVRTIARGLPPGQELEILGFDACEMALMEVWSELQDSVPVGIASEAGLPYLSWPYDTFLRKLLLNPGAEPEDVAKMLTSSFADLYAGYPTDYVTLSACAIPAVQAVNAAAAKLARALMAATNDPWSRQQIFTARNYSPQYDTQGYIDFGCFCRFLQITLPNTAVSKASAETLAAIEKFILVSVFSPNNKEKKISHSTGVSVWMPEWIEHPDAPATEKSLGQAYLTQGYGDTQFAVETGWDQLLTLLCARSWGIGALGGQGGN